MTTPKSTPINDIQRKDILKQPICFVTVGEFLEATGLGNHISNTSDNRGNSQTISAFPPKYVYGLDGLAGLLGCSVSTASRLKRRGVFDGAISQINRTIVIEVEKAMAIISEIK